MLREIRTKEGQPPPGEIRENPVEEAVPQLDLVSRIWTQ